jgi:hypothetical protein
MRRKKVGRKRGDVMRGEGERNLLRVEMHKTQRGQQELLNNKWPDMNKEIAPRKLLTGDKVTELRN